MEYKDWQAGDIVRCISLEETTSLWPPKGVEVGKEYKLREGVDEDGYVLAGDSAFGFGEPGVHYEWVGRPSYSPSNYQRTAAWLQACGRTPNDPAHISVQAGVDAEEFAEWLACLRVSQDGWSHVLERITQDLSDLATAIKTGKITAHVPQHLRVQALDALCDRGVTGNGVAYLLGMDKPTADSLVLDSNDAKLPPVVLPGGKIGKPDNWKAPDLRGCV